MRRPSDAPPPAVRDARGRSRTAAVHCVTCSDEGTAMRVTRLDAPGLATCVDEEGTPADVMIGLVEDVRVGDRLLVHAGAALMRLDDRAHDLRGEAEA